MSEKERTSRGFRVFGIVESRDDGRWRVQESSLACEGAHVRILCEGATCVDFTPQHSRGPVEPAWKPHVPAPPVETHLAPDPHLSVAQAKQLIAALQAFVDEAEAGALTEPAEVAPS